MNSINVWFQRIIRSKTIHVANIIALLGIIQANSDFLSTVMSPKQFGWIMFGIAIVVALLRTVTTNSLSDK